MNSSVLFRFSNSTRNSQSSFINIKFQKSCRNDVINQTFLNQFYNFNQINEYLIVKECRYDFVFKKESKLKSIFDLASQKNFTSTTIATILAYSLIIALIVFLLVFCTAMSLFCVYRMTTKKKTMSEK